MWKVIGLAIILAAPFLLLPWRFALRLGWGVTLALALGWLVLPRTPYDQQTMGYAIGQAIIAFLVFSMATAFLLRLVVEAVRRTRAGRPLFEPIPGVDHALALTTGLTAALVLFMALAWSFAGLDNALAGHGITAALAAMMAVVARRREPGPRRWSAVAMSAGLWLMTLGSLTYPWAVLRAAEARAEGKAHCIWLNERQRFAARWLDLSFLTFDKGRMTPHATLVLQGTEAETAGDGGAHKGPLVWSYRQWAFQGDTYALPGPPCPERAGDAGGMIWAARDTGAGG